MKLLEVEVNEYLSGHNPPTFIVSQRKHDQHVSVLSVSKCKTRVLKADDTALSNTTTSELINTRWKLLTDPNLL